MERSFGRPIWSPLPNDFGDGVAGGGVLDTSQPDGTDMALIDTQNIHGVQYAAVESVQELILPQKSQQRQGKKRNRLSTPEEEVIQKVLKDKKNFASQVNRRKEKLDYLQNFYSGKVDINDFLIRWERRPEIKKLDDITLYLNQISGKCQIVKKGEGSIEEIVNGVPQLFVTFKSELDNLNLSLKKEKNMVKELQEKLFKGEIDDDIFRKELYLLSPCLFDEDLARPEQDNVYGDDPVLDQAIDERIGGEQTDDQTVDWVEEIDHVQTDQVEASTLVEVSACVAEVVQDDAPLFGSSSAALEVHAEHYTSKVDFHGFQILAEHAEYLEHIYAREKEFWSTCHFKGEEFITFFLNSLGKALMIAQTPWASLPPDKLNSMLELLDNVFHSGFKLDFLKEGRRLVEIFANADVHQPNAEAELARIAEEIAKLDHREKDLRKSMEDIGREKALLEERGIQLKKNLNAIVEIRNSNLLPWDALQKRF